MSRRPHLPTLIVGMAIVLLGVVLLLDRTGLISPDFYTMVAITFGAIGVVLIFESLALREDV